MPVYEYSCDDHGVFEVIRPVDRFRDPAPCPACELPGHRLLSAPSLATTPRSEVIARERNERSRHEPRVASCKHGHSDCGGHRKTGEANRSGGPELRTYRGPRPWVVEHA